MASGDVHTKGISLIDLYISGHRWPSVAVSGGQWPSVRKIVWSERLKILQIGAIVVATKS